MSLRSGGFLDGWVFLYVSFGVGGVQARGGEWGWGVIIILRTF